MKPGTFKTIAGGLLGVLLVVSAAGADSLYSAVKVLAKGAAQLKHNRVAVLLFPYENGNLSSGSSLVSTQITTLLAQRRGVKVIERSRLASVLSEIRLEQSGAVSSSTTAPMGEILGVDAVVTGTLHDLKDDVTVVNMRLIDLPTGEILTAASARVDREWEDLPVPPPVPAEEETASASGPSPSSAGYDTPIVFTPNAHKSGHMPVESAMDSAPSAPSSYPSDTGYAAPRQNAPQTLTIIGGLHPNRPLRTPAQAIQAQYLYSIGLTLDQQGNHAQARRFYRSVLQNSPASAPLREMSRRRLHARD